MEEKDLSEAGLLLYQVNDLRRMARVMYHGPDRNKIAFMRKTEVVAFILKQMDDDLATAQLLMYLGTGEEIIAGEPGRDGDDDDDDDGNPYDEPDAVYMHPSPKLDHEQPDPPELPLELPAPKPGGNDNGGADKLTDDLADGIAKLIRDALPKPGADIDEYRVRKIVGEMMVDFAKDVTTRIEKNRVKEIVVKQVDGKKIKVGQQHRMYEKVLGLVANRMNVSMIGPAGSGKTMLAEMVAKALDLPFYSISVGLQTSKSDLFGFTNANGGLVRSLFREAYENGGVFLVDEFDSGNANVAVMMNAALANDHAAFPDGMVKRHKDFVCIAAGNTFGHGGDIVYVGRNQLDGATLDRFVQVIIDYDENLERTFTDDEEWFNEVMSVRKAAAKLKERLIVSPRATLRGSTLRKLGLTINQCKDMLIYRGISSDIKKRVEAARVG